jgi:stage II sporulation protein D
MLALAASGQVKISVFNSVPVKVAILGIPVGSYTICDNDGKVLNATAGKNFYVTLYNKQLLLNNADGTIGTFDELYFKPVASDSKIKIIPVEPKMPGRTYLGGFTLRVEYGRILMINETDIETYIAGVVEAEAGNTAGSEFQKAQALLCRTYLYKNLCRHESEGFNLCDEVHCQAYHGQTPFTPNIFQFTHTTNNKVITGLDNKLIAATFHANCGGETESPGNTWLKESEYMVPVKDPYCQKKRNSSWTKEIPLKDWRNYLAATGLKTNSNSSLSMLKNGRQLYYKVGNDSIATKKIRDDWSLKSSYFKVAIKKDIVSITGHGYGHGVGLCQDGANVMAAQGFLCEDIIRFYFKNVSITEYKADLQ